MDMKDRTKTLTVGTGVAIATAGLGSCGDGGHGDPPPPPADCRTVDQGETLSATATVTGRELRVEIRSSSFGLSSVAVSSVVGGSLRSVVGTFPVVLHIDLADANVRSGSFVVTGSIGACAVLRTFTFTIQPTGVVVASADDLPLPARQQARIAVIARDGHDVDLEATTPFRGPSNILWTVTGGEIVSREGARIRWRLPAEAGLYQAEVVIDYGPRGLSIDTLALEVTPV